MSNETLGSVYLALVQNSDFFQGKSSLVDFLTSSFPKLGKKKKILAVNVSFKDFASGMPAK